MSWRLLRVGVYSKKNRKLRDVKFNLTGLSIITGPSSKGKSSILDIVDYCLLSDRCPIAKGFVRLTVSHVAVLLVRGDETLTIVRPLPSEGRLTSTVVHVARGTDQHLPSSPPEARWSIEAAKEMLSDFTGIESIPVLGNQQDSAMEARTPANIRHCSFYLFQPQDVIASRNVAFSGLDDFYKKSHAADAAYYFLGILTIERLRKRRELRALKKNRNALERQAKEGLRLKTEGFDHGLQLWSEALGLGLINDSQKPSILSTLLAKLKEVADLKIDSLDQLTNEMGLAKAQADEANIRQQLRQKSQELAEIERFGKGVGEHEVITDKQLERLDLRGLLPASGQHDCPVCGNESVNVAEVEELIESATAALSAVRTPPRRISGKIEQQRRRLKLEIEELTESQSALHARLKVLFTDWEKNRTLFEEASRREQLLGRIKEYLASMRRLERPTDQKLGAIIQRIDQLEKEVGDGAIRNIRQRVEKGLTEQMTEFAKRLDVEFRGAPVRINFTDFALEVFLDDQWVKLNELGSGANWLGYHVASTVALHRFFRQIDAPVPALLMLDQPSQVWFPSEKARITGQLQPSEDRELSAVRDVYQLLYQQSKGDTGPQIIVVDHAKLENSWFRQSTVEDWHEGGALVPESWRV